MKKILALALALVMMFAVCVPAFAQNIINDNTPADENGKQTAGSRVYTDTQQLPEDYHAYVVTIPAETKIAWGTTKTLFNYHVKTQLDLGKRLAISATSQNGLQALTNAGTDKTLPYTFSQTNNGPAIPALDYTTESEIVDTNRSFNIDILKSVWDAAPVAEYEDYLTFTVEVVDASVEP